MACRRKEDATNLVVLEVHSPDRVALSVEVLVEPRHGDGSGVVVGVLPLPLVEDESGLREKVEGVLGGGDIGEGLLLLLLDLLGLGGGLGLLDLGGLRSLGLKGKWIRGQLVSSRKNERDEGDTP